jgi:hypothetical protein
VEKVVVQTLEIAGFSLLPRVIGILGPTGGAFLEGLNAVVWHGRRRDCEPSVIARELKTVVLLVQLVD